MWIKWRVWRASRYERPLRWFYKFYGRTFVHEKSGIIIRIPDTGVYTLQEASIEYQQKTVLEWKEGEVYRYHPGTWEKQFWKLYHHLATDHFQDYEERFTPFEDELNDHYLP